MGNKMEVGRLDDSVQELKDFDQSVQDTGAMLPFDRRSTGCWCCNSPNTPIGKEGCCPSERGLLNKKPQPCTHPSKASKHPHLCLYSQL
jgi:hypothetical protein